MTSKFNRKYFHLSRFSIFPLRWTMLTRHMINNYMDRFLHFLKSKFLTQLSTFPPALRGGHSSSPQVRHNRSSSAAFSTIILQIALRKNTTFDGSNNNDLRWPKRYSANNAQKIPQLLKSLESCDEWRKVRNVQLYSVQKELKRNIRNKWFYAPQKKKHSFHKWTQEFLIELKCACVSKNSDTYFLLLAI